MIKIMTKVSIIFEAIARCRVCRFLGVVKSWDDGHDRISLKLRAKATFSHFQLSASLDIIPKISHTDFWGDRGLRNRVSSLFPTDNFDSPKRNPVSGFLGYFILR